MNVQLPDSDSTCPAGTEACSASTSVENTVCYAPEEHAEKCPITEIKFMTTASQISQAQSNSYWTVLTGFNNSYALAFSKNADSLPITSTDVQSNIPCMRPDMLNTDVLAEFYYLEYQQEETCDADVSTGRTEDTRYSQLSAQITEYDLQGSYGIITKMESYPKFYEYVIVNQKKLINYNFYTRATLPYACE